MDDSPQKPLNPQAAEFGRLFKETGWTQSRMAEELTERLRRTFNNSQVSRWMSGGTKIPSDALDAVRNIVKEIGDVRTVTFPLTETAEVVPLYGYSSSDAKLRLTEDQRVGTAPMHPAQRTSKKAFAVRMFGGLLAPRIKNGDWAFAVHSMTPIEGEPCVIELSSGEALIKIFDTIDANTLFYSELSPKRTGSVPRNQIIGLHAVVGVSFGGAGWAG